ncbi:MAG: LD-carboxypeptidase [Chloroflexaceae bacterium]|nr:LD-carboxypeptidase [Chloroflexaceae bacterium]
MLGRRPFLVGSAATAAIFAGQARAHQDLKPPRLQPGAGVGLLAPGGAVFEREKVAIVEEAMEALGLVPYLAPHLFDRYGYLAGSDRDRAQDINEFFADPKIQLLLPLRGGWGCARVLPYLDYETIKRTPKILVGFSDITSLLLGIYAKTGLITFHGPNGISSWRPYQTDVFRRVLFGGESLTFANPRDPDDEGRLMQVKNRIQTIQPGRAQGRLIGGNLSVLSGIVGSPYWPGLKGAILFVEDVGETIYRVDRLLTHLKLAGVFEEIAGFIFGECTNCLPDADYGSLTLEEVVWGHIQPLGIPAWYGAAIGHVENIITLPVGGRVEIDAAAGTIRLLEAAVV